MTVEEMIDAIQRMYFRVGQVRVNIEVEFRWHDAAWHMRIPNLFVVDGTRIINHTWAGNTLMEAVQGAWSQLAVSELQAGTLDDSPRFWIWNDDTKRYDKRSTK